MSRIFVPSKKIGLGAGLPTDLDNSGYRWASSEEKLLQIAQYVNRQEWHELATGANIAFRKYSATSNGVVMGLLCGTLGLCFCPLMCYTCFVDVEGKINADIEKLPVTQRLNQRGITFHFVPKSGKFDMGGMSFTISATTPTPPPV